MTGVEELCTGQTVLKRLLAGMTLNGAMKDSESEEASRSRQLQEEGGGRSEKDRVGLQC